jgi:opacity protein-like surface antigen
MRRVLIPFVCALALLCAPRPASADILLTPFAGVSFLDENNDKLTYGVGIALGGLIGIEGELGRTSLGETDVLGSLVDIEAGVTTGMVNMVVRFPSGPLQPYFTGGLGLIRATSDLDIASVGPTLSLSGQTFGMNYGGGIYLFPSSSIGIRADVRYFRTVGDLTLEDVDELIGFDLPLPDFDFWRVTGGVTIRF